jgi:phospholipase C
VGARGEGARRAAAFDRRRFLEAAVVAGAGALALGAAGCGAGPTPTTVRKAAGIAPAGSDLGAIEHVIYLMQENRSFDHYYGTFPGVRGMPTATFDITEHLRACVVEHEGEALRVG